MCVLWTVVARVLHSRLPVSLRAHKWIIELKIVTKPCQRGIWVLIFCLLFFLPFLLKFVNRRINKGGKHTYAYTHTHTHRILLWFADTCYWFASQVQHCLLLLLEFNSFLYYGFVDCGSNQRMYFVLLLLALLVKCSILYSVLFLHTYRTTSVKQIR